VHSKLFNEEQLADLAISDSYLLYSLSGVKVSILLLDACRSNDFALTKGGSKGLGQPTGRLKNDYVISYATEVGKVVIDGDTNSPYAKALAKYLVKQDSLVHIFTKVRAEVRDMTNGKQKPFYEPHLDDIIYLNNNINNDKTKNKIDKLIQKCHFNNGKACAQVGSRYQNGKGVKRNYKLALKFYKKSCELKYKYGCARLGFLYEEGTIVKKNKKESLKYFKKACDLKFADSCVIVGERYRLEDKKNESLALKYYKKACDLNSSFACAKMGSYYFLGDVVKPNYKKALKYYKKACDLGDKFSCKLYKQSKDLMKEVR